MHVCKCTCSCALLQSHTYYSIPSLPSPPPRNQRVQYLCDPLRKTLKDDDPYVRKTAAVCVAKLYDIDPELVMEQVPQTCWRGTQRENGRECKKWGEERA